MISRIRCLLTSGALAFCVLPAFATDTSQLVGHWHGQGQSETDRRFIIPCVDVLNPGVNNRFQAEVEISLHDGEIIPCVFPADLVLSEGGVITGGGVHEDEEGVVHRLVIHGRVREVGNGLRLAAFSYKILLWHGGLLDEGHIALFQVINGDSNPNVGAYQHGSFTPEGERFGGDLDAVLENEATRNSATIIGGTIRFGNPPDPVLPALLFDVAGTFGPAVPEVPAAFALIGITNLNNPPDPVQPTGIIAILIGEANPPEPVQPGESNPPEPVRGTYQLYESFYDLFTNVFHGADSSFSQGSFELPAVQ
jgi:hypothetical protein